MELPKTYDPQATEGRIYRLWEESGFFNPDRLPGERPKPYTIVMPPPNANGHLHAGHALFITLEDIMIRYKRMRGFKALWVPGADHAGFETQIVYEKKLEKENRSRFDLSPEQLYREIMDFTLENKKHMENEVRSLGASCDWSRERFTLDPDVIATVHKTFKKMYDDGLVYRGTRIINWCSKHQTSLSDVETEDKEQKDPFYYLQYGPFVIGTSRPETKFGDKYVVMHPDDTRYADYKDGQQITVEWINGPITATIIKDKAIDMEFGTGVMTITPWHDAVDFAIAERHGLEREQIIDFKGKLLPISGEFAGKKIAEARPLIIEKLKEKGLLVKVDENYTHNIHCCYKCGTTIEPQIKDQWFVKMQPLARLALKAVEDGNVAFMPDNYRKIFNYWMSNTIDWNISRQIVWGITIPAKVCNACNHGVPDLKNAVTACPKCGGSVREEMDTFDTWFSSGQWPLIVLNYPDGKDFKNHYPTDVMETGYDLIFKWVPRMVIFGLYLAKEVPFSKVYLHGLVNDAKGKKMSKSKGNVINPLDITAKYGTDALRIALVVGNTPGTDLALSEDRVRGYKNFANKLWNIARFALMSVDEKAFASSDVPEADTEADKDILGNLVDTIRAVTDNLDKYNIHEPANQAYQFIWHEFADKYVEACKAQLADAATKERTERILAHVLVSSLKLLHPFMPFVTEEIWSQLPIPGKTLLMIEKWPS